MTQIRGKYLYFSERATKRVADDNRIDLDRYRGIPLSGKIAFPPFFELELGRRVEKAQPARDAAAARIEKAIGDEAVTAFLKPPKARFAKGFGRMQFMSFTGADGDRPLFHTCVVRPDGYRVDLVLFGSMDNTAGYVKKSDGFEAGWSSSAWWAVTKFLRERINDWDDLEDGDDWGLAYEALKIALMQGQEGKHDPDPTRPHLRGGTWGHHDGLEWFTDVYLDVERRPTWLRDDYEPLNSDRIIIGAPLWIRTARPGDIVKYDRIRKAEGIKNEVEKGRHRRKRRNAPEAQLVPPRPSAPSLGPTGSATCLQPELATPIHQTAASVLPSAAGSGSKP